MRRAGAALAAVALLLAGCSARTRREVVVFAAASLTESFTSIRLGVEQRHSDVRVRFNFGPSGGLATGIQEGATADVFASAGPSWMDAVAARPGVIDRTVFARNRLVVITPADNPASVDSLADLARPGVKLVLASSSVPVGLYAREALRKAGIEAAAERNVVSNEADVKGVVQKVLLGEADAGITYATDVTPSLAKRVAVVAIDDAFNVVASYPIAVVAGTRVRAAARAFVAFVVGEGQTSLREAGFLPP